MENGNLEEEIEALECVFNNIDDAISTLKNLSSNQYGCMISQCQELLNDIDYSLIDKQEMLDNYTKQQLMESRLERYEREINYKQKQDF